MVSSYSLGQQPLSYFLKAFLAFPLLSFELMLLPFFRCSAEVIKPHLLWHCESAELAEQFQPCQAPSGVHRKHRRGSIIGISVQDCRYCQPLWERHNYYKSCAFHSQGDREKGSGWMILISAEKEKQRQENYTCAVRYHSNSDRKRSSSETTHRTAASVFWNAQPKNRSASSCWRLPAFSCLLQQQQQQKLNKK